MKVIYDSTNNKYNAKYESVTKYYKYVDWTTPTLSSNTSSSQMWIEDPKKSGAKNNSGQTDIETWGTTAMGQFSNVYKGMNSDTSDVFTLSASNVAQADVNTQTYDVFDICFSNIMKITHIKIVCKYQDGYHCALKRAMVYAINNDGSVGTRLMNLSGSNETTTLEKDIENNRTRKIRVCLRPDWNNNSYKCQIQTVEITAQKSTAGTSSDYDYSEQVTVYKLYDS